MIENLALARMQFAANITFHILFPTINIALAWVLCLIKWQVWRRQDSYWQSAYRLWIKIFALTFALGVVSGITMSAQFGTNWPGFMIFASPVAGPLLSYEVLSAFFLEATFLGIMLFGQRRVSPGLHTLSCFIVAIGTTLSAFWIMALNSWMHTPSGISVIDGHLHVTHWWQVINNPSMWPRLTHMLLASSITTGCLIIGLCGYRIKYGYDESPLLKKACIWTCVLSLTQIFCGDILGLNTLAHQPAKIAAIEGVWHDQRGAPLLLAAIPDNATQSHRWSVGIPTLASLILTHQSDGLIRGLSSFEHKPQMTPVFWSFRVMVGTGLLILLFSIYGTVMTHRSKQSSQSIFIRSCPYLTFLGWVATCAGWYVTEVGRQPWLIYGLLKTADAVSDVSSPVLLSSFLMYLGIYISLIIAYISTIFYLARQHASPAR